MRKRTVRYSCYSRCGQVQAQAQAQAQRQHLALLTIALLRVALIHVAVILNQVTNKEGERLCQ